MSELLPIFVAESGMAADDLVRVIESAPSRYKVYYIPKRSGELREIAQPARELKVLQRILIEKILSNLPMHPAATAYRSRLSILDNALPHRGSGPLLKLDFENFFPSITAEDWLRYCADRNLLSAGDRRVAALVMFRRAKGERILKLSVGAPSSPMLSNVMMYAFDEAVCSAAAKRKIKYTRYADDMTFSGQRAGMLKDMIREVTNATRMLGYPKLKLNKDKTTFVTAARRRSVTGIVLSNDGNVGIGHARRRLVSAKVHRATLGKLNADEIRSLAGELAFINAVDPAFLVRLAAKYGQSAIDSIKHLRAL